MENKVYKVLSEWKLDNIKKKYKAKVICKLWIYICVDGNINKIK